MPFCAAKKNENSFFTIFSPSTLWTTSVSPVSSPLSVSLGAAVQWRVARVTNGIGFVFFKVRHTLVYWDGHCDAPTPPPSPLGLKGPQLSALWGGSASPQGALLRGPACSDWSEAVPELAIWPADVITSLRQLLPPPGLLSALTLIPEAAFWCWFLTLGLPPRKLSLRQEVGWTWKGVYF